MERQTRYFYEFSDFRVDVGQKCLWYRNDLLSITPKAFETLVVLIENRGRIVDKDTLLNKVWENTFVEESTLAQNISTLRKLFSACEPEKQFIETFPRRGYRFTAEVREVVDELEVMFFERQTKTEIVDEELNEVNGTYKLDGSRKLTNLVQNRPFVFLAAAATIAIVTGMFFAFRYAFSENRDAYTKFNRIDVNKVISSGDITMVTMSPDGKYVALREKKGPLYRVLLQQVAGAKTVEIVPQSENDVVGLAFSPDSSFLYYTAYGKRTVGDNFMVGALYRVPILGGAPVEVVTDIDSPVAISPDHQRLAFVRGNPAERENYLMVMDLSTKNETRLGSRTHQERFSAESLAWSPDGKMLTIPVYRPEGLGEMMDVLNIDIASGEQTKLNKEPLRWVGQTAWLRDGSGLVAAAFTERSPDFTDELWIFSYPSGDIRKITNGINGQFGISVSADSNSIATIQSKRISSLWAMPVASFSGGETEQAAVNSFVINKDIGDNTTLKTGLDWTREGRIVYSSAKGGNNEIFSVNGDGSDLRQLTADALSDVNPIVSPNQDFIIFLSNRSGSVNLWRMNMDGTEQKQLTSFAHVTSPSFTPDGQWIFFAAYFPESQGYYLWKIPANGGDPVKLTDFSVLMPALSPDGKQLACYARGVNPEGQPRLPMTLSLLSSETGKIEKQFPELKFAPQRSALRWMPDGKSISYVVTNGGVSNIWTVSLSDEKTKRLSNWQTDEIFRYAWSDDGQKVAFEKGLVINDVLIISNAGK